MAAGAGAAGGSTSRSDWVRKHFVDFEDRDHLLADLDKYLATLGNEVLVASLLAGLAFSSLFGLEQGKFTKNETLFEPCVISVVAVLVTNLLALVLCLAIYHSLVFRGSTLDALQMSATLAEHLEIFRNLSTYLLKVGFIGMASSTMFWTFGTVGGRSSVIVTCLLVRGGVAMSIGSRMISRMADAHYAFLDRSHLE